MRKFSRILIRIFGSGGSYLAEHLLKKKIKSKIFGVYNNSSGKYLNNISLIKLKIFNVI